jgi:chemotaxis protein MotB
MMAFFLVMWLVAQSSAVKNAVAGYFKDPGIFDHEKSNGVIPGGELKLDPDQPPGQADAAMQLQDRAALERAAGRLKEVLGGMPEFEKLQEQIEIHLTPEGLRIELVERNESTFFDSGSATLKAETERILGTIATELGKLENTVVIEGHTDSTPYTKTQGYTNWELSADRANAARRVMERLGLHQGQIQAVRGFADRRLRTQDQPYDPRNRRVSIVVQNLDGPLPTPAAPLAPATPSSAPTP